MSKRVLNGVFAHIRKLAAVQTARECGDRDLLDRFIDDKDEAAFAVLVERHGPVVLGLCRRVLRHAHDADDACQATFLVLARKAGSLRKRSSLTSWLHGVAYRIAVNLKREQARRLRREQRTEPIRNRADGGDVSWRELHAILDEELQRLPERYRAPLILCYLDGKTRDEAARQLGTRPGRLHGLLERGRAMLRERLTQRGVTLSAALLVTALPASAAKAALAPPLAVACTQTALALCSGQPLPPGLIAPHVLSLAQEVMKVMLITKVKVGTALLVCAGLLTVLATGSFSSVSFAQDASKPADAAAAKGENDEDFIRRVSKDLRGVDPTPAEIHFFRTNLHANKRQKLVDLFIQERQAKQAAEAEKDAHRIWFSLGSRTRPDVSVLRVFAYERAHLRDWVVAAQAPRFAGLQEDFYKQVLAAAKEKKDVATITQNYLDRLMDYVKTNSQAEDVADAMLQISLVYRSQGKSVEADAWRDKLRKEHPKSSAAKTAQEATPETFFSTFSRQLWIEDGHPAQHWARPAAGNEEKK